MSLNVRVSQESDFLVLGGVSVGFLFCEDQFGPILGGAGGVPVLIHVIFY